jgi:hypothetical protein
MAEDHLVARLRFLWEAQNPDGGWGYFPGKRSWLEPTVYAMLAGIQETGTPGWERAWTLVRSWQLPDGAFHPSAQVEDAHWSTALAVSLHCVRGVYDSVFERGVGWLLASAGAEGNLFARFVAMWRGSPVGHDLKYRGWPWRPDTSSWIEPTAHSLVALKKASGRVQDPDLKRRVLLGEQMILCRRCEDGGWNYGSKQALGVPLPSYPETTALALLGLQGNRAADLGPTIDRAKKLWQEARSPLARAWLAISLKHYGASVPAINGSVASPRDVMITALEVLASPSGPNGVFRPAMAV